MNGSRPADLKAQVQRLWDRQRLPRALVNGEALFPYRLTLKAPGSQDISDRFDAVRRWAAELESTPGIRLERRELRHRVQGRQWLPHQAWIDTIDDALALIGRRNDARRLTTLTAMTRDALPAVLPWLERRPLKALDLADAWPQLLGVCDWLIAHPRPGVYLRQVDIPGVHSKFIEVHRGVLTELLDLALPAARIDTTHTGINGFNQRYGFADKPVRIRFRALDPALVPIDDTPSADITLDAASFARLRLPVRRVFVTENETNFLAFPATPDAIVLFGAGYGWSALSAADWLRQADMDYWGDIDTHGFAILNQLRAHFAHVRSFLMDRDTLLAHEPHWGEEPDPIRHDLPRLTDIERTLYNDLRDNRIQARLRLEQERIGFGWLQRQLLLRLD